MQLLVLKHQKKNLKGHKEKNHQKKLGGFFIQIKINLTI